MSRLKPNFTKTIEQAKKEAEGGKKGDERFWYPRVEKTKDALYKYLFVPSKPDEEGNFGELCFEKIIYHDFEYLDKNGKKRFWRKPCNKMLGQDCPICDKVSELWDKSKDETVAFTDKDKALRDMLKLKHRYITNIYVVEDPADEANQGKVFLTLFPAKGPSLIFDKVLKHLNPSDIDLKKESFMDFNPYDPFATAIFLYHYQAPGKSEKYGNYDASEFGIKLKPLAGTSAKPNEKKIEEILYSAYDLEAYLQEYTGKAVGWDEIMMEIGHILEGKGNSVSLHEDEDINDDDLYEDDEKDEKEELEEKVVENEEEKEEEVEEKELEDEPEVDVKTDASDADVLDEWADDDED